MKSVLAMHSDRDSTGCKLLFWQSSPKSVKIKPSFTIDVGGLDTVVGGTSLVLIQTAVKAVVELSVHSVSYTHLTLPTKRIV